MSDAPSANNNNLESELSALRRLLTVLARLRAPDGCPWDRVQTVASLAPYLLEESYEAVDAIASGSPREACEELGDVLMNVLMIPMAGEADGAMSVAEVADAITQKLIRRHPHVFDNKQVSGVGEVWRNWELLKAQEKRLKNADASAVAGVPRALPACLRALRMIEKAQRSGFRYGDLTGPIRKVEEEWRELRHEIDAGNNPRAEEELGDLLFAIAVLASGVGINPEIALRKSTERFERRFRLVERELGDRLKDATIGELLDAWERAKVSTTGASENSA